MTLVPTPPDERRTFSDVLERLGHGDQPTLSLREVVDAFGERGFGALILILSLMALFPWPPGGKAIFSAPIILLSAEMALQRDRVWLPGWILNARVNRAAYRKTSLKILKPLRFVERLTKPRLPLLTNDAADVLVGVLCILLAMMMALPVPFGDALPGLTLAIFGLAIIQRDGFAVIAGLVGTAICGIYLTLVWTAVVAIIHGVAGWFSGLF